MTVGSHKKQLFDNLLWQWQGPCGMGQAQSPVAQLESNTYKFAALLCYSLSPFCPFPNPLWAHRQFVRCSCAYFITFSISCPKINVHEIYTQIESCTKNCKAKQNMPQNNNNNNYNKNQNNNSNTLQPIQKRFLNNSTCENKIYTANVLSCTSFDGVTSWLPIQSFLPLPLPSISTTEFSQQGKSFSLHLLSFFFWLCSKLFLFMAIGFLSYVFTYLHFVHLSGELGGSFSSVLLNFLRLRF